MGERYITNTNFLYDNVLFNNINETGGKINGKHI